MRYGRNVEAAKGDNCRGIVGACKRRMEYAIGQGMDIHRCQCGKATARQRYTPGLGWAWLCYACAPDPRVERTSRHGKPMAYMPRMFHGKHDGETREDPAVRAERINAKIKSGDYVARNFQGKVNEAFKAKVH